MLLNILIEMLILFVICLGCKSNAERAAKMLELLREKGLEGEPTLSKCRQLKVDYLTKKEIEDLDPNLIIQTEGIMMIWYE